MTGDPIVNASLGGTAAFLVTGFLACAVHGLRPLAVVVAVALFAAGTLAFVVTLAQAAERSRRDEITLMGLWWLTGSTPEPVRRRLLGSFWVQVAGALAIAWLGRYTALAAAVLVPVYGLGLAGLWAVRRGVFPPRV